MNNIKLKCTRKDFLSHIDVADDPYNDGLFATVWRDPDGSKGNRLTMCWNEHDELVRQRDELVSALENIMTRNLEESLSFAKGSPLDKALKSARALLAKIGGEK